MELCDLTYVVSVSECGSVTGAARLLGLNPSTISRHVAALEDELGVLLFEKRPAGSKVTTAGRAVIALARRVRNDVDAIRSVASKSGLALVGELRLATQSATLGPRLRRAIAAWRKRHADVSLKLFELADGEALARMRDRRVDVAVV